MFTLIEMFNKVLPFFLLPILAKKLSPADFGIITNYTVLVSILLIFINFGGIPNIIVRYRNNNDQTDYKKYLNSSLVIGVVNTIISLVIIIPLMFTDLFKHALGLSIPLVFLAIVETFFDAIIVTFIALSRFSKSFKTLAFIRIGQTLVGFGLTLILVYKFGYLYEGRIFAIFISSVLFGVVAMIIQGYGITVNKIRGLRDTVKHLYNVCWPLIPHQLSKLLRNGSDKIIITTSIGLVANGLYSMSLQFATIFYIVSESFSISFLPVLYEKLKKGESPSKIIRNFNLLCFGMLVPFYGACFLAIQFFFDHRYQDVKYYLLPMLLAFFVRALNLMQGNQFMYFQKTKDYSKITVLASLLHLCLSVLIANVVGLKGLLFLLLFTETIIYFFTNWKLRLLHEHEKLY